MERFFCQSCGMPLIKQDDNGINANNNHCDEYCGYCFQNGEFTSDCTMDEMINHCAGYLKEFNSASEKEYTMQEAILGMKIHFPTLKRWKQKGVTVDYYHEAVNKVINYINDHLYTNLDLKTLSSVASISEYHFHRIFKAIIGETIAGYIQRIRLEDIAHILCSQEINLTDLAEQSCYGTKYALSKAFKKHFGVSPAIYRNNPRKYAIYREVYEISNIELTPEIKTLENINVVYVSLNQTERTLKNYSRLWNSLKEYVISNNLIHEKGVYLSFSFDDPEITPPMYCRYSLCYSTLNNIKPAGIFSSMKIESGTYAIFRIHGSYENRADTYRNIYNKWLPEHKEYRLRNTRTFEMYVQGTDDFKESDLITDIYIPIEKII